MWLPHKLRMIVNLLRRPHEAVSIERIQLPSGQNAMFWCHGERPAKRARRMLTKEPRTIEWLDQLKPGETLWDVGANIGTFTLYAAMERGARVIAFEPVAANYYALNRNIELNKLHTTVTAYCISLASSSKLDALYLPSTKAGAALASFGSTKGFKGEEIDVKFRQGSSSNTLDDAYRAFGPPDMIKIDVDGSEHDIVAGGSICLADHRVRSVRIEMDSDQPKLIDDMEAAMLKCGLRYTNRDDTTEEGRSVIDARFDRR